MKQSLPHERLTLPRRVHPLYHQFSFRTAVISFPFLLLTTAAVQTVASISARPRRRRLHPAVGGCLRWGSTVVRRGRGLRCFPFQLGFMIIEGRVIRNVLCFAKTKERLRRRLMVRGKWDHSKADALFHPLRTLSSETLLPFSVWILLLFGLVGENRNSLAAQVLGFYVNEWGWLRLLPSVLYLFIYLFIF